jgi:hypothetical protein
MQYLKKYIYNDVYQTTTPFKFKNTKTEILEKLQ